MEIKKVFNYIWVLSSTLVFLACGQRSAADSAQPSTSENNHTDVLPYDSTTRTIHVLVALCDNTYQGIVPVPKAIGNGQDPVNNLYWGCEYGIKTYFNRSKDWKLLKKYKAKDAILERLVYKHRSENYYLVADAYDGKEIKLCTVDFLRGLHGQLKDTLQVDNKIIGIAGNAKLNAYIGHDGLMDFQLDQRFKNTDHQKRNAIILACYSKKYFAPHIDKEAVNPILWTSHLMCPEAYSLHDALTGYINGESNEQIQERAAKAYSKYQKCSLRAAKNLLITNW
ncbi:hypothetical protein [Sphingobacterium detergens]|uniref:Uncharacterized protein n=1 Tax=Sphingobacterium detergens TaxID=1145106 RepID=A0A420AR68_SPHD1|nr:hypothetical protein [Sphingobacterium detergens]RKE46972.1 hypothetical protein DFQ12_4130 [Sphingobacterium detergens]